LLPLRRNNARRGEFDAARQLAREAVPFAEQTDALAALGDALMDLAEVVELAGRREEAAAETEKALSLYQRKGNLVMAERARTRLAEISAPPPERSPPLRAIPGQRAPVERPLSRFQQTATRDAGRQRRHGVRHVLALRSVTADAPCLVRRQ
jgi:tetratricopeptide (TPR) repeat protein